MSAGGGWARLLHDLRTLPAPKRRRKRKPGPALDPRSYEARQAKRRIRDTRRRRVEQQGRMIPTPRKEAA